MDSGSTDREVEREKAKRRKTNEECYWGSNHYQMGLLMTADSLRDGTKGFGTCLKTLTAGEKTGLLTHQLLSHTDCGSILES